MKRVVVLSMVTLAALAARADQRVVSFDNVLTGPTVAVAMGPVRLQAIAGYGAGRGLQLGMQRGGLFGLATVSADL